MRRAVAALIAVLNVAVPLAGCADPSSSATPATITTASAPVVVPQTPASTEASRPPGAWLAVDGGDPVEGALGTFTWGDAGSDSPWLPGASFTVGAGEPLTITVRPATPIETWTARYVPVSATDPTGAIELATGRGSPSFAPPPVGSWTVEVRLTYADDAGGASYAWAITVE